MQGRGRLAAERLEQTHGSPRRAQLVNVVDDEHHVVFETLLERLAQPPREGRGPLTLGVLRPATGLEGIGQLLRQARDAPTQRGENAARERDDPSIRSRAWYQTAARSAAQDASSVVLPKPAPATTSVTRLPKASSSRRSSAGRSIVIAPRERAAAVPAGSAFIASSPSSLTACPTDSI
jgi:hypothetical protein